MAVVVVLILALLTAGIAWMTMAELEMGRLTRWDAIAQYLAQAATEHQVYLLKRDKDAGAIPYTNYPSSDPDKWYVTSLSCLLNCTGNPSSRRWSLSATGEIRQYNPDGTWTVLQTRTILTEVDITYDGVAPDLYRYPQEVTVRRWEEALP